ncbi:MAG: hypothetical protein EOO40_04685, partial [Deltaproteobacteria bacterium]
MADGDTDKEHPASGKQREKYAEEGQIARSRDLSAALLITAFIVLFATLGSSIAARLAVMMQQTMRSVAQPVGATLMRQAMSVFWLSTAPFFAVCILLAVGIAYWQNGYSLRFRPLKFDLSFLTNVGPRLLQIFEWKESGVNLAMQAVKMSLLAWVCGIGEPGET